MTFPKALPHEPLMTLSDGLAVVRGSFQMGPLMRIGRTMTVIEVEGGLAIINAVRLSEAEEAALLRRGPVRHLIKLSDSHGVDEPYYVDRFKPEVWVPAGSKDKRLQATRELGPDSPIAGAVVVSYPGATGWCERGLWIPNAGGTLITCDALQNHVDAVGANWFGKVMTPLIGFKGGVIVAPMWRKYQKVQPANVQAAFVEVNAHAFENLITGHGPAVCGGASAAVRSAVERAASGG